MVVQFHNLSTPLSPLNNSKNSNIMSLLMRQKRIRRFDFFAAAAVISKQQRLAVLQMISVAPRWQRWVTSVIARPLRLEQSHRIPQQPLLARCSISSSTASCAVAVLARTRSSLLRPLERHGASVPPPIIATSRVTNEMAMLVHIRYNNHGAKKGLHMETLAELAHSKLQAAAEARRRKKKERNATRLINNKGKKPGDGDDVEVDIPDPGEVKEEMKEVVEHYKEFLRGVRGAQPTADMFDDVVVLDAYGKGTGASPLSALGQVVISGPTLAVVTCYDPSVAKAVGDAILKRMELNPTVEEGGSGRINVPLPRMDQQTRQHQVHTMHTKTEDFRKHVRNIRNSHMKLVKEGMMGKIAGWSKDDAARTSQELDKVTELHIQELNQLSEIKEKQIMAV
jgi:ribosome recycling factor